MMVKGFKLVLKANKMVRLEAFEETIFLSVHNMVELPTHELRQFMTENDWVG